LQFALDGKNGKNAYISYPDRIIVYAPSKDSVYGIHYNRDMRNDSLIYIPKDWETGITKSKIDGKVVIKAPWYQTGIIPFEDRTIGFGAFALNSTSAQTAAVPSGAKYFIPGTWGDLLLKK